MNNFRKTLVHQNLVNQLKIIKKNYPRYRSLSLPEVSARVKLIPLDAKKESVLKRVSKILEEMDKNTAIR